MYLVVSGHLGVVGRYFDLEQAKDILNTITSGARLIAEVVNYNSVNLEHETQNDKLGRWVNNNKLLRDPHKISGQPQAPEAGFNKAWGDWSVIFSLMDIAEKYLQNLTGIITTSETFIWFLYFKN